jgi:hypothetical protein
MVDGSDEARELSPKDRPRIATLGEKLAREAQRIAGKPFPSLPWLRAFRKVVERAAKPLVTEKKFERVESARVPEPQRSKPEDDALTMGPGEPLASDLAAALRWRVGEDVSAMRVHVDERSDRMARARGADAVGVGPDVFFRRDRFEPREERGFGLLVHEATHVAAAMSPNVAWTRGTQAGIAAEESVALQREHAVLRNPPQPRAPLGPPQFAKVPLSATRGSSPAPASPSPAPASHRPMAAESDRPASSDSAPSFDIADLKRSVYDDLMQRIRIDFERGA